MTVESFETIFGLTTGDVSDSYSLLKGRAVVEGPKILVIDDDEKARQLIQVILRSRDYQVVVAKDGPEGLALATTEGPDLIVLDVVMPGMDGFEACDRLKKDERTKGIPVLMLTATDDVGLNRKAFGVGAAACLTKPYRPEALVSSIEALLASKRRALKREGPG